MLKRIISLALVFVMLPTLLPDLQGDSVGASVINALRLRNEAFAESLGAFGEDYDDIPEEEHLASGDWTYAVLPDGYAVILSYNGTSRNLTIPDALSGYWVTSVAKGAFTKPLNSIRIHGNITSIAEDAFACEKTFTIKAYNGTHALSYAKAQNISYDNLSELEFVDGVIDFTEINRSHYSYISSSQILLNAVEGRRVSVGTMFYLPPDDKYELGEAFEVLSVKVMSGGVLLDVQIPEIESILEKVVLDDVDILPDYDNIVILTDGVTVGQDADSSLLQSRMGAGGEMAGKFPLFINIIRGDWEFRGGIEIDISAKIDLDIQLLPFKVNSYTIKQNNSTLLNLRARRIAKKTKIQNKINKTFYETPEDSPINLAKSPFASNGLVTGFFVIKMELSIYGEFEFTFEVETETGETYYNGRRSPINKRTVKNCDFSGGATAKILPSFGLSINTFGLKVGELKAGIGPRFDAEANIAILDISSSCIDLAVDLVLEVSCKIGNLDKNWYVGGIIINGKWHLFDFHIENWKIVETCSQGKKVVQFYSSPGSAIPAQSVATGEKATKPSNPKRPGYEFTGWYTTSALTTLWDFTQPVTGNMVLYAGWNLVDPTAIDPEVEAGNGSEIGSGTDGTTYVPVGDAAYLNYTISGGEATITGYVGNPTRLNIPDELGGAPVTAIASKAFQNCTSLTEITFPDTLETIGSYAFDGCIGLDGTVVFPADLVLEERAFQYCSGIDDLEFEGYIEINLGVFRYCTGLTHLILPSSYLLYSNSTRSSAIFYGCSNLKKLTWDGFSRINDIAVSANSTTEQFAELSGTLEEVVYRAGSYVVGEQFKNFAQLKSVTFADELQVVGKYAFYGCTALETDLDLSQAQYIGEYAFYNCMKAKNLELGSGLTNIGNYAFYNCDGITGTVDIKGADLYVGEHVFNNCNGITKAVFSADNTEIHVGVFKDCTALEEVVMNSGVDSYYRYTSLSDTGNNVFAGCTNLKKLSFGSTESSTGYVAQAMLYELRDIVEEITLNEGAYGLRENAFANFTKLRKVHFPSTFRQIDANAFSGCTALETVDLILADDVTVASGAFTGCTALKDVRFGKGVVSVAANAFDVNSSFNAMCYYGTPADECLSVLDDVKVAYFRDDYLLTFDYQADDYKVSSMYSAGTLLPQMAEYDRDGWEMTGWFTDASGTGEPVDLATMAMPAANLTLYAGWTRNTTDFVYIIENDQVVITEYVGPDGELIIPSSLGGYPVVGIGAEAIGDGVKYLTIPATVTEIDSRAFADASSLTGFTVSADNTVYMADNGVLFSKDGTKLLHFAAKNAVNVYTVPENVTEIGAWAFAGAAKLTDVTLNDQIAVLPKYVFYDCTKLANVVLPNALVSIGDYAFGNCDKLLTLNLPDTIESIGDSAFVGCSLDMVLYFTPGHEILTAFADEKLIEYNLYELNWYVEDELIYSVDQRAGELIEMLPLDKPEYASWGGWKVNDSETLWDFDVDLMPAEEMSLYAVKVNDFAYEIVDGNVTILQYVGRETEVHCPSELDGYPVTQISENVFEGMDGIVIIADAGSVWEAFAIEHGYAFSAETVTVTFNSNGGTTCTPIEAIRLSVIEAPSTIRTGYTFTGWYADSALTTLWDFENNVVTADMILYAGWENDGTAVENYLTYEDDGQNVTITGYRGIKGTVTIPESINGMPVTAIADYAFYGSSSIVTVALPETITKIGEYAFAYSTITEVTIPDSVTEIGESAFADCTRLTSAELGTGCVHLPAYLFDSCSALLVLNIPEGVTSIGRNFIANAHNLLTINLPDSLVDVGSYAFANCGMLEEISFGPNVSYIQANLFNDCAALLNLNVDDSNLYYSDKDGALYDKSGTTLVRYPEGKTGAVTIPDSVMILGENSFSGADISQVVIPSSVLRISDYAFAGCSELTQIQFATDSSVAYIGNSAFSGCGGITTVTIPDSTTDLGDDVFAYCVSLTALTVPEGVTTIGSNIVPVSVSLILYGQEDSAIETYAKENGIRFIDPDTMVAVEGIAFDAEFLNIELGASEELEVLFTPENTTETGIAWSSSDASVVYVDDMGIVSARKIGSSVITATAVNGVQASITIDVEAAKRPVAGIMLNSADAVTVDQYEVVQILAQVLPVNADNQTLKWSSSDATVAVVDQNGLVTALKPGAAVITAASLENEDFCVEVTITVNPIIFEALLVDEITVIPLNGSVVIEPVISPRRHEVQYEWSSSDTSVITVDQNGTLTATGSGPAVIGVRISDGFTTIELSRKVYAADIRTMTLPAALVSIDEEAFVNAATNEVVLSDAVISIGSRAFADNANLLYVHIPDTVESIAEDAFSGCEYLTLMGSEGSYVQEYAEMHGYYFKAE